MRDGIFVSQVHNRGPAVESGKVHVGQYLLISESGTVWCIRGWRGGRGRDSWDLRKYFKLM